MTVRPNFRMEKDSGGRGWWVRDVPIFAVCSKSGIDFDEDWLDDAIDYNVKMEANRGAMPVVIQHTPDKPGDPELQPAGMAYNTRKAPIRSKTGVVKPGAVVDILFTNRDAAERARNNELLWRSPEIPATRVGDKLVAKRRFKLLSLLDRHAPHNDDLPVLTFKGESGQLWKTDADGQPWTISKGEPVLAFSANDDLIVALMEPEAMAETDKPTIAGMTFNPRTSSGTLTTSDGNTVEFDSSILLKFADDDGGDDDGGGDAKLDVAAVCKAIEDGSISIAEFAEITAAMEAAASASAPTDDDASPDAAMEDDEDKVEDGPGDVGMQNTEEVVKLSARVETLEAEKAVREKRDACNAAADAAISDLAGRETPADIRDRLIKFGEAHGADAIKFYADDLKATLPPKTPLTFEDAIGGDTSGLPEEVLKFQAKGPDAFEWAIKEAREHELQVKQFGKTNVMSLDRWLEIRDPTDSPFERN